MAEVAFSQVQKKFGTVHVIHDVTLSIRDGDFVALVGPSGCGKSTLLRMLAGLESVSSGDIEIGARTVTNLDPKDRDIAMVFQNYALYPHMSVKTNMGFSLEHRGASKAEIEERVTWAARILGLEALLDRYPRQLSGGQRQRVAMGRAIVRQPQVFLFDEPLSNLDAKLRIVMRSEIKALHQTLKTTTLYVTHDQTEAMSMADTVVVLHAGRIEQVGAPLELYDKPSNQFVAGFIGSPGMNFIEGAICREGFLTPQGVLPLSQAACALSQRAVVYGIRPEHIKVSMHEGIPAKVLLVEPMGSETHITLEFSGGKLLCLMRERLMPKPGSTVFFQPEAPSVHLFDAKTRERITEHEEK